LNEFDFKPELETRPIPLGAFIQVGASLCGGRSYAILKDFFRETLKEFTGQQFNDAQLYQVMDHIDRS
jgi:sedoheptulokinase